MKNVRTLLTCGIRDVLLCIRSEMRLRGSSEELELRDLQDKSEDIDDLFPRLEFDL